MQLTELYWVGQTLQANKTSIWPANTPIPKHSPLGTWPPGLFLNPEAGPQALFLLLLLLLLFLLVLRLFHFTTDRH